MKSGFRILFSKHYWANQASLKRFLERFFSIIGAIAAMVEAGKQASSLVNSQGFPTWVQAHAGWVIGGCIISAATISVITIWPRTRVVSRLKGRDLDISVEISDLFDSEDTVVIGTNCTFDTELEKGFISKASVQGQYTEKYFNSHIHLDTEIEQALANDPFTTLLKTDKPRGKLRCYPVGTVAKLATTRSALLLAMSTLNQHGVASGNMDDLRTALIALWRFVADRGGDMPNLRMPALGTNFAKVGSREDVIREILQSFVAASTEGRFCNQLTIAISVKDYLRHQIDLERLGRYLNHLVEYTDLRGPNERGAGTPLHASMTPVVHMTQLNP